MAFLLVISLTRTTGADEVPFDKLLEVGEPAPFTGIISPEQTYRNRSKCCEEKKYCVETMFAYNGTCPDIIEKESADEFGAFLKGLALGLLGGWGISELVRR